METKTCKKCKNEKPTWHFARWASSRDHWCRECRKADPQGWKRQGDWRLHVLNKYGLFLEDVEHLRALRDGACWICGRTGLKLHIDHCHKTTDYVKVRGLLCHQCNTGVIGDDVEWLEKRLAYLKGDAPTLPRREWSPTPDDHTHPLYRRYVDLNVRFREQGFTPEEWLYFEGFVIWSEANGWEPGKRLLRPGNRGPYEPANCYWSNDHLDSSWPDREKSITAWGETKILSEWLSDERVVIDDKALFHGRVASGWSAEKALSTEREDYLHEAWGEQKTLREWLSDPRVRITEPYQFHARVYGGWSVENALGEDVKQSSTMLPDFPKADALQEGTVRARLRSGYNLEKALTTPLKDGYYEVRGETKHIDEWLEDPHRQVGSKRSLFRRLREGWDFEEALIAPDGRAGSRKVVITLEEHILKLLAERPMTKNELLEELPRVGYVSRAQSPSRALQATLSRMDSVGLIERDQARGSAYRLS